MSYPKLHTRPEMAVLLLLLAEWGLSFAVPFTHGLTATLLYYASYLLPIAIFALLFAKREELAAHRPTVGGLRRVLPLLPIFLAAVLLTSSATGYLMDALSIPIGGGAAGSADPLSLLLSHALLPALLEEGLMRLCVLSLLARRCPARAVPQSALLFALLHASLYQMPYAFVGGVFLALAVLYGGSVLYAMLFHLLNNLLSLLMQSLPSLLGQAAGLYANLGISLALFLLSAWGVLVLLRRRGQARLPDTRGWLRELICSPLIVYLILMLLCTC